MGSSLTQSTQLTRHSGQIFLDYEIKNIGQALASDNFTRFYYSSDTVLDSSDFDVGNNIVNSLQKNESFQGQVALNTSPNASQKYLLIQTDISNLITESDELNNVYVVGLDLSSTTSLSDLTISGLSVSNKTNQVTQGYGFIPTYTLKNKGNASSGTSVTKYVISKDAILGNADDFIPVSLANGGAVAGLAAGASRVENDDYLVIYDNITSGLYNLFAIVDSTNTVAENNENNNVLSVSINFSSPSQPDLQIEKFTSSRSVHVGSYLNVAYTIRNIDQGYVGYSHINFYLSQNTVIDSSDLNLDYHLISSDTPTNIPISRNRSIWLDPSKVNAGTYNLIAKIDPNDGISESNEANNTFIDRITLNSLLLPNLSVGLNSPKTIQTGSLTTIPYTVFNTGGATKESQISFYLSTNSALDSTDKLIRSQNVQALSKKSSVKADASVYFEPNLAALGTNSYSGFRMNRLK
jgi:subtilase family serine protease